MSADWIAVVAAGDHLDLRGRARDGTELWAAQAAPGALENPDGLPVVVSGTMGAPVWTGAPGKPLSPPISDGLIHRIPGVRQASPPDLLWGQETTIAGFLALNPGWDGVICLPGARSAWVEVSADEIISFRTFVSSSLFDHLSEGWHDDEDSSAFQPALEDAMAKPEALTSTASRLQAAVTTSALSPGAARAALRGALIGAELATARPYWLGRQVGIMDDPAAPEWGDAYATALAAQHVPALRADGPRMTQEGLLRAYRMLAKPGDNG